MMERVSPSTPLAMKQSAGPDPGRPRVPAPPQARNRKAISREHQLRQLINDLADLAAKHRPPHQQNPASA
jgi:hypothetical protein